MEVGANQFCGVLWLHGRGTFMAIQERSLLKQSNRMVKRGLIHRRPREYGNAE